MRQGRRAPLRTRDPCDTHDYRPPASTTPRGCLGSVGWDARGRRLSPMRARTSSAVRGPGPPGGQRRGEVGGPSRFPAPGDGRRGPARGGKVPEAWPAEAARAQGCRARPASRRPPPPRFPCRQCRARLVREGRRQRARGTTPPDGSAQVGGRSGAARGGVAHRCVSHVPREATPSRGSARVARRPAGVTGGVPRQARAPARSEAGPPFGPRLTRCRAEAMAGALPGLTLACSRRLPASAPASLRLPGAAEARRWTHRVQRG
jgi:hypothetical protein